VCVCMCVCVCGLCAYIHMHVYVLVCVCVSVSIADWHAATLLSARQLVPKFVPHLPHSKCQHSLYESQWFVLLVTCINQSINQSNFICTAHFIHSRKEKKMGLQSTYKRHRSQCRFISLSLSLSLSVSLFLSFFLSLTLSFF